MESTTNFGRKRKLKMKNINPEQASHLSIRLHKNCILFGTRNEMFKLVTDFFGKKDNSDCKCLSTYMYHLYPLDKESSLVSIFFCCEIYCFNVSYYLHVVLFLLYIPVICWLLSSGLIFIKSYKSGL